MAANAGKQPAHLPGSQNIPYGRRSRSDAASYNRALGGTARVTV
jgi:hypothetical protein